MIVARTLFLALALTIGLGWCVTSVAQDTGRPQDDALDSLLEKLEKSGQGHQEAKGPPKSRNDANPDRKPARPADRAKSGSDAKPAQAEAKSKPASGQAAKPAGRARAAPATYRPRTRTSTHFWRSWGRPRTNQHRKSERGARSPASLKTTPSLLLETESAAKRKPGRRSRGCKARTRKLTTSWRSSPARSARRRAASGRMAVVPLERLSKRCAKSSRSWASRRRGKTRNPSRSASSSRSRP